MATRTRIVNPKYRIFLWAAFWILGILFTMPRILPKSWIITPLANKGLLVLFFSLPIVIMLSCSYFYLKSSIQRYKMAKDDSLSKDSAGAISNLGLSVFDFIFALIGLGVTIILIKLMYESRVSLIHLFLK